MLQRLKIGQHLSVKQKHRLIMKQQMRYAFQILQMPINELESWIETQVMQNPLLEWKKEPLKQTHSNFNQFFYLSSDISYFPI